jgi:hypothetical protein
LSTAWLEIIIDPSPFPFTKRDFRERALLLSKTPTQSLREASPLFHFPPLSLFKGRGQGDGLLNNPWTIEVSAETR